ncbi:methionine gamma-lyase family protein [Planktothrix agardhii 1029]|jgi:cystathionine beta-lyase family protein involved in aluminum resistance|uniref:Aluminum resistance family protein n=1 Tax=Planktothrix agardhii TaxID=1160 RepID=A0A1J1JF18_PLAAG|nr:methionine gamma-lyase family protein [Planktothrix agardhii]MBG0748067.1 methionine gamma-lyase family protein [Planktothrix agardhii KL2]MCF3574857.1 methionine gamma-lyase family protein [Planktothrix agardhii 1812]MCF3581250.1 methionine gamma-lyase family protein [Planktothrix agardhii 1811]MCF3588964.1 methionine gamma-lyase family protein [Planktothrix agardhii 1029]MCF3621571.1 methionine gamma-lyase family protein [Planktothrix agardhii 1030]
MISSIEQLKEAEQELFPIFSGIDTQVKHNLKRVLDSFRRYRVGTHHFAGVTGYGHDDLGRQTLDQVFAEIMGAESAAVRVQFVSGTHAITCALFGCLRPGDELLAVTGAPYDTLEEVIGVRGQGQGSLLDFGISYRQLELTVQGKIDWEGLRSAITAKTRMVLIQRSCGYSWRLSLSIDEIEKIVNIVKKQNPHTICFVDNCYGEFIENREPTAVGVDLMAGSLIKNPGGTIVQAGGYVAGREDLVEAATCRLTAPGIGSSGGATFDQNRILFQGLFLAPQMVGEAIKGTHLTSYVFNQLGYPVNPLPFEPRRDVIQAIELGSPNKLIAFCRAIQQYSPIGSYLEPVPAEMHGYESHLVMAGGTFIDGSTSEFSADGPLREPYIVFCQGGTHWTHISLALEAAIEALAKV